MLVRTHVICHLFAIAIACAAPVKAEVAGPRAVRMGYSRNLLKGLDEGEVQAALMVWTEGLVQSQGRNVIPEFVFFEDVDELVGLVKDRRIDMFQMGAMEYLESRHRIQMDPAFVAAVDEDPCVRFVLLVRRSSDVSRLSQLAGKSIILSTPKIDDSLPQLWLTSLLLDSGLGPPDRFFSEVSRATRASQSVISVFFGQTDACVVKTETLATMFELNPQLESDLAVLAESESYLGAVACFPVDCDPEIRDLVTDGALQLQGHPGGRQILTLFGVTQVMRFEPVQLSGLEQLLTRLGVLGRPVARK